MLKDSSSDQLQLLQELYAAITMCLIAFKDNSFSFFFLLS